MDIVERKRRELFNFCSDRVVEENRKAEAVPFNVLLPWQSAKWWKHINRARYYIAVMDRLLIERFPNERDKVS